MSFPKELSAVVNSAIAETLNSDFSEVSSKEDVKDVVVSAVDVFKTRLNSRLQEIFKIAYEKHKPNEEFTATESFVDLSISQVGKFIKLENLKFDVSRVVNSIVRILANNIMRQVEDGKTVDEAINGIETFVTEDLVAKVDEILTLIQLNKKQREQS